MNSGLLTFVGVVLAAAITGAVTWVVNRKSRAERTAGLAKTLAEADTGVAMAADTIINSITRDYQRLSKELEAVRADVANLHAELNAARMDRETLLRELDKTKAENVALRKRVDDLEALTQKGNP